MISNPKGKLVQPVSYFTGFTVMNHAEVHRYLTDSDQLEFAEAIGVAKTEGLDDGEILCSFYAKACYAALTTKHNLNISRVRDIADNIAGTIKSGHGSVFEHCQLNFMVRNCSRVYTHEQVRHRVGTAFSQTSGRYVRSDKIDIVFDPILEPVRPEFMELQGFLEGWYGRVSDKLGISDPGLNFDLKKKLTSAMRRGLPNGQTNEMGYSMNLRTMRNTMVNRTSRHAEWEIRLIYGQFYDLIHPKYPAIFADVIINIVDGLREITFSIPDL